MFDAFVQPFGMIVALAILSVAALLAALRGAWHSRKAKAVPLVRPHLHASKTEQVIDWLAKRLDLYAVANDPVLVLWLKRAGLYRRPAALNYLLARILLPLAAMAVGAVWLALTDSLRGSIPGMVVVICCLGLAAHAAPAIYVQNLVQRRQEALRRHWPDALDLLLLAVESGLGIDAALDEVSRHLAKRAPVLAQELRMTIGEMSYLSDRKLAFSNLASRCGIPAIGSVTTALVQAERYGTPIGTTLRSLTKDSGAARLAEAERRAAALPPRLTIPMILFFLPVLFAVIFTPGVILYLMDK